jgi:hypothetical protein
MLKLLKWVYNRGVQAERARIKVELRNFQHDARKRYSEYHEQFDTPGKGRPKPTDQMRVDEAAMHLVDSIIEPTQHFDQFQIDPAVIDRADKSINDF